jgi:hypothetical protein
VYRLDEREVGRLTMGQLKARLTVLGVSPELAEDLDRATTQRNYLAHRFFWNHAWNILTMEGCHQMIDELERLAERFQRLDEEFDEEVFSWMAAHGVTRDEFDHLISMATQRGQPLDRQEWETARREYAALHEREA